MSNAFRLNIDSEGIARLVFDLPGEKINKLSPPVMEELEHIVDELSQNKNVKALAISSGKEDVFIAGADIHSFEPMFHDAALAEKMILSGHRVLNKLSNLPYPSIALINGACLGGGMELALACTYRLVSDHPKTLLGLPEVTLGIIPGWGGTQRMPRLVGLVEGLPLILSGKPIKANKAWKIKLADAIVPAEFFESKSNEFIKYCLTTEGKRHILKRRKLRGTRHFLLEENPLGRSFVFNKAEKDLQKKTKGHYPAPLVALALIKESYTLPLKEGLNKEIETITKHLPTTFSSAKNLMHLFFVQESLKKETGAPPNTKTMKIASAGILGAGKMGSGIAWLFSDHDYPVRFKDVDWSAVGHGYSAAHAIYAKMVKDKKMKPNEANLKFHRISGTIDYSGFNNLDIVIEAAVENLELKHRILKELEDVIRKDAIIATNTSSLTIAEMSKPMSHPERFVGMHFFNPPNRMPLVEVVSGEKTTPEVVATAVEICRKLGKTPIVVRDCHGFLVNRIFVMGSNEIMLMLQEGASFEELEKMMLDFGMPMSPFVLSDEVGNDVCYKVAKAFEHAYGERMKTPSIIEAMDEHKLYGKKTGKGFYLYNGKMTKPNPEVNKLLTPLKKDKAHLSTTEMRERTLFVMINEAARCLQENIVDNPDYLDMALIMGVGFPPFRGGLLHYADELGINYVVNQLKYLQEQHGIRFAPCELLVDMQRNNKTFFK
jgi:3-hydroxyacyl-CoA dehydrogenase / enoyl-CoA hydratase / 3-hydroxybutyryl-CoA epimerase